MGQTTAGGASISNSFNQLRAQLMNPSRVFGSNILYIPFVIYQNFGEDTENNQGYFDATNVQLVLQITFNSATAANLIMWSVYSIMPAAQYKNGNFFIMN